MLIVYNDIQTWNSEGLTWNSHSPKNKDQIYV